MTTLKEKGKRTSRLDWRSASHAIITFSYPSDMKYEQYGQKVLKTRETTSQNDSKTTRREDSPSQGSVHDETANRRNGGGRGQKFELQGRLSQE